MDTRSELTKLKEIVVTAMLDYEYHPGQQTAVAFLKAEQASTEEERRIGIEDVPEYQNEVIGG